MTRWGLRSRQEGRDYDSRGHGQYKESRVQLTLQRDASDTGGYAPTRPGAGRALAEARQDQEQDIWGGGGDSEEGT